jgi:hypothetical protein
VTRRALAAVVIVAALLAGCGGAPEKPRSSATPTPDATPTATPRPQRALKRPPCRAEVPDCSSASGRIVYVERVDPDGDGDAHFVLVSRGGITAPGLSVIDVKRSLRPSPLPGPGDWISAAGPVQTGSHGQSQIEAVRVRVVRRG